MLYNLGMICNICPRHCKVDRKHALGFCGVSDTLKLAKADVFMWEEPCISGINGSGAIFFSGCNLKCCFCQNYKISSEGFGKEISVQRLAQIFKELEQKGVHNINLVSPSHFMPQIAMALDIYKPNIPIVYNSNGYDDADTLKKFAKYIDIYLVDLKFCDSNLSLKYCKAKDYFLVATKAINTMTSLQPKVIIKNGIMQKGVVIRHLVMPNCTKDSFKVLDWINANAKGKCLISLMGQYTPYFKACQFAEINRKIKPIEYKIVLNYATKLGLDEGYAQQLDSGSEKYIPIWDLKGV